MIQYVNACCAHTGFRVIELGAGTGSFTGQAYPILNEAANSELLQYTCTDISDSAAAEISNVVRAPNVAFKVALTPSPATQWADFSLTNAQLS